MGSPDVRATWNTHFEFLLSTIGFAVDLANIWRFPFLVYSNGGGAFLIPYFLILLFVAFPSFYMELLLGQTQRESMISVWKICPLFKGIGFTQLIVNSTVMCYYNIIIAWSLFYFFATITGNLPWMRCTPDFRTKYCVDSSQMLAWQQKKANYTARNLTWPPVGENAIAQLPSNEYFERVVLGVHKSKGLEGIGYPQWQIVVCGVIIFILLFLFLRKGVRSSGRVVYISALLPYVLLIAMLIQGVLLKGSVDGIKYFIIPNFEMLKNPQVWFLAATQIFFSVGSGFGIHITFASYNQPNNKALRDCIITCIANSVTSLLAGFVVFAYLGYMANLTGQQVKDVATEGPGLVFQVYSMAVGTLPVAPLWSLLLFLLIILLGVDSSMGGIESLVSGIKDEFSCYVRNKKFFCSHIFILAIFSIIGAGVSAVIATGSGILILQLMDYSVGIPLVFTAFLQLVGVTWFYGLPQFCNDVKNTCGYTPSLFFQIFWKIISPCLIIVLLVLSFLNLPPMFYRFGAFHPELASSIGLSFNQTYNFPTWADGVVWGLRGVQLLPIPLGAIFALIYYKSFYYAVTPATATEHEKLVRRSVSHWFAFVLKSPRNKSSYSMKGYDNPTPIA